MTTLLKEHSSTLTFLLAAFFRPALPAPPAFRIAASSEPLPPSSPTGSGVEGTSSPAAAGGATGAGGGAAAVKVKHTFVSGTEAMKFDQLIYMYMYIEIMIYHTNHSYIELHIH